MRGLGICMKVVLIIIAIIVPSFLLGFVSALAIWAKVYTWVVILLGSATAFSVTVALWIVKGEMKRAQLRSNLVSSISHELKTPLTSINMFADILLSKLYEDESDRERCLHIIQKECNRLEHLIERALDFSKMEKGKKEFHYERESIREVVISTVETFRAQLIEGDCKITVNIPDNLPKLQIDKLAISSALLNLLSNAEKYSSGEKKIAVDVRTIDGYVAIEVTDNGIGIPKRQQRKIFEPFYRMNDPWSQRVEGSGLGLAIVKYIVSAHNGKVTVQSKVGHGSKFTLLLPRPDMRELVDANFNS